MVHNTGRQTETTYLRKKNFSENVRTCFKPKYKKRINNDLEIIYNTTNPIELFLNCVRLLLKAKRLEWAGHVWRAGENLIRSVLIENATKMRSRGRPRLRWTEERYFRYGRVKKFG